MPIGMGDGVISVKVIAEVAPLALDHLVEAVDLDRQIFGGWWGAQAYQQEVQRDSSTLIGLRLQPMLNVGGTIRSDVRILPSSASMPLIGMGCLWRIVDEAHITLLGVHPHYQRQGLGQALLLSLMQAAHYYHSTRMTLEVSVANSVAVALYTKFGFQIAGRRPHYYDNGDDALVMWRRAVQTTQFLQLLQDGYRDTERRLATWDCTKLKIILD